MSVMAVNGDESMARPVRCRRVCAEPACRSFGPQTEAASGEIVLTVDEYEALRLIDYERRTHEQCAAQMEISRTTATEIYESARFKLADSLVNGKALVISGGHYRVCRGERGCGRSCRWTVPAKQNERGGSVMRIAVTYEDGQIFQHFGHTEQMKVYDIEEGRITGERVVDTTGSGHGALAGFLSGLEVDTLICGGIGGGAQAALAEAGIRLCGGVSGGADEAVRAFLAGTLDYSADVQCSHHDHHGEQGHCGRGEGHCGEDRHGCSGNGGGA